MTRTLASLLGLALLVAPSLACKKTDAETTPPADTHEHQHHDEGHDESHHEGDLESREVVDNWKAQPGDVTVCPMSGKKFEVTEDSGRFDYQGHSFVFCCANCLEKVEADPGQYLDELVEQAGGSADAEPADATSE